MNSPWARFAWRGIRRHPRRSLLVVLAIAAGLFVLVFLKGLQDGFVAQRLAQGLDTMLGQAQVLPAGASAMTAGPTPSAAPGGLTPSATPGALPAARDLGQVGRWLEVLQADPQVLAASARIRGQALARSDHGSTGVVVLGVEAEDERAATRLPGLVVQGNFLPAEQPGPLPPAAVGVGLAASLGLRLGDRLALLAEGHDGSLFAEACVVAGLFESGGQLLDGGIVYLRRADARRLFAVEGEATEIVLHLADALVAPEVAVRLGSSLSAAAGPGAPAPVVLSWHESAPELLAAMEMLGVMERLRTLVLFVLVGLGILNAVVMSVFERRREFGVLLAIGLRPGAVLRLLLWEVALLACGGVLLGAGSAWLVTDVWLGRTGLDVFALGARLPGALEGSSVIHPLVSASNLLAASAWVAALALLVLAWPARSLLRLDPAAVLRDRG